MNELNDKKFDEIISEGTKTIGTWSQLEEEETVNTYLPEERMDCLFIACPSFQNIQNITIPLSVEVIGTGAFYQCRNLQSVTIPSTVKMIGAHAFENCKHLKEIIFQGTKLKWKLIKKQSQWNYSLGTYTVRCTDGEIKEKNVTKDKNSVFGVYLKMQYEAYRDSLKYKQKAQKIEAKTKKR